MKKNVMMRVASIMLVLVLMSSSVISGTFAKYVTEGTANAEARVAKWGVEFVTATDGMFQTQYDYDDVQTGVAGTLSVKATEKVVAPGTECTGYSFTTVHNNGPEVSYEVTFKANDACKNVYLDSYFPVAYTLTIAGYPVVTDSHNFDDIKTGLLNSMYMFDVDTQKYYYSVNAGTSWMECGDVAPKLVLSWEWPFEQSHDKEDTTLGYLASGYALDKAKELSGYTGTGESNLNIVLNITATATQVN